MADKPKLIRFTCPTCAARLAVPLHLAGVEDQCPKCGTVVMSPLISSTSQVTQKVEAPAVWPDLQSLKSAKSVTETNEIGMPSLRDVFAARPVVPLHSEIKKPFAAPEILAAEMPMPQVAEPAPRVEDTRVEPAPVEEIGAIEETPREALDKAPALAAPVRFDGLGEKLAPPLHLGIETIVAPEIAPLQMRPHAIPKLTQLVPRNRVETIPESPPFSKTNRKAQTIEPPASAPPRKSVREIDFRRVMNVPTHPVRRSLLNRFLRWGVIALSASLLIFLVGVVWLSISAVVRKKLSATEHQPASESVVAKNDFTNAPNKIEPPGLLKQEPASTIVTNTEPTPPPKPQDPLVSATMLTPGATLELKPAAPVLPEIPAMPNLVQLAKLTAEKTAASSDGKLPMEKPIMPATAALLESNSDKLADTEKTAPASEALASALPPAITSITLPDNIGIMAAPTMPGVPPINKTEVLPEALLIKPVAETSEPSVAPLNNIKASEVPVEAKSALVALKSFLGAPNWHERLQWCQKQDSIRGAMEKYYQSHPPGPINATQINFIRRNPGKSTATAYCMFEVLGADLKHPVVTYVEQPTKGPARVDWETFMEFKDDVLEKFLSNPDAPHARFRVTLRRAFSYDKTVPDLTLKDPFDIIVPLSQKIYCPKGGATQRELANTFKFEEDLTAIVELAWRKKSRAQWVELVSVPVLGWKG